MTWLYETQLVKLSLIFLSAHVTLKLSQGSPATPSCTPVSLCLLSNPIQIATCTTIGTYARITWRRFKNETRVQFFGCASGQVILSSGNILSNRPHVVNCPNPNPSTRAILLPPVGHTYTSTLSVSPSPEIDGDIIRCYTNSVSDNLTVVHDCQLNIAIPGEKETIDPPPSPGCDEITSEDIAQNTKIKNIAISWTEPSSEARITSYFINVNPQPSVFPTECGGTTNPCMVSPDVRELHFQLVLNTEYTVYVSAISQCIGYPSTYIINIRVPAAVQPNGAISDAVNVVYDSSGTLTSITVAWRPVRQHIITGCGSDFGTISYVVTVTGDGSVISQRTFPPCTNNNCSYTYSPPDNSPSYQYTVAVAAMNIIGQGPPFITSAISAVNDKMKVVINSSPLPNVTNLAVVPCRFLPSFVGLHKCTLLHGTSPTTQALSIGPGIFFLIENLQNNVQFYTAKAKHEDFTLTTVGSFTTSSPPPSQNCPTALPCATVPPPLQECATCPSPPQDCMCDRDDSITTDTGIFISESKDHDQIVSPPEVQCVNIGIPVGITFIITLITTILVGVGLALLVAKIQRARNKQSSTRQDTELKETAIIYEEPDVVSKPPDDIVTSGNIAYGPVTTHQ